MAMLQWDNTGERLYETGVDRGVLFVYDPDKNSYGAPTPWNGLTTVTETPSGAEPNPIYADNIKYLDLTSREEFGGTIEAYTYPEEFALCDGSYTIGGLSAGQQARRQFAFAYRTRVGNDTQGDDYGYKIHIVWGAKAQPSEKTRSTVNDTPEPTTMSWTFTTTPPPIDLSEEALQGLPSDSVQALRKLRPTSYVVIDSTKADEALLEKVEKALWDDSNKDLPNPIEFITDVLRGAVDGDD